MGLNLNTLVKHLIMKRIERYKQEKEALVINFGELNAGTVIRVELADIGAMIPRKHLKASSYDGLINYIARTTGAQIYITSQRGGKGYASE